MGKILNCTHGAEEENILEEGEGGGGKREENTYSQVFSYKVAETKEKKKMFQWSWGTALL